MFRSALPRRERPRRSARCRPCPVEFRSALPRRERPAEHIDQSRNRRFDPRSREGSDRSATGRWRQDADGFDPRSREGSDPGGWNEHDRSSPVSIRAPAKGATFARPWGPQGWLMFRSALPRRERPILRFSRQGAIGVSIRAPAKGATPYFGNKWAQVSMVSIRAPAKGATPSLSQNAFVP